jgi:hypothetical protein
MMWIDTHTKHLGCLHSLHACQQLVRLSTKWKHADAVHYCVCGDVGREVIRLTHSQGNLIQGQGPYLLLTPYTHGVPHVDCEGPCAVTRTNPLLPPGRKALETCPHQESNRVPREMQRCTLHLGHGGLLVKLAGLVS